MMDTVLFDLDGTLLPMDQDLFVKRYLGLMAQFMAPYGYDPKRLVGTIWAGTEAMVKNDGSRTNEAVFWEVFRNAFGARADSDGPLFDEFYATAFAEARTSCGFNAGSAELIAMLRARGIRCVLATNPLFPRTATLQRIRWAGLDPADFDWITTYDNSCFCKPNPEYYREILGKIGKKAEQCLMVGNDGREDTAAAKLGIPVFLLTDCLLHGEYVQEGAFPCGDFAALRRWLEQMTGDEAKKDSVLNI